LDEVYLKIGGRLQYLWRAVDQEGNVLGILVQPKRDKHAAERFFRKLLRGQGYVPRFTCAIKALTTGQRIRNSQQGCGSGG
jgi:putative transposase